LGDEKAGHDEEDEDADMTELGLTAGQQDQRLVRVYAFGNEEGVGEDHQARRRQTQRSKLLARVIPSPRAWGQPGGFISTANMTLASTSRIAARSVASSLVTAIWQSSTAQSRSSG
jgi:hypothetical protein